MLLHAIRKFEKYIHSNFSDKNDRTHKTVDVQTMAWEIPGKVSQRDRPTLQSCDILVPPPGLVSTREGCGASMLLWSVATAMIFLLWMQSFVTSSSALTSSAVLCFTAAPGSKLNTWKKTTASAYRRSMKIFHKKPSCYKEKCCT